MWGSRGEFRYGEIETRTEPANAVFYDAQPDDHLVII